MKEQFTLEIEGLGDLEKLASRIAMVLARASAENGIEVSLEGNLGAGKTTLTRMMGAALNVSEPVSSPSFVLEHEYHCRENILIEHWDLYRLGWMPDELIEPPAKQVIRMVEWGNRAVEFVERCDLRIILEFSDGGPGSGARRINVGGRLAGALADSAMVT